jgi:Reverse transcriptase (RNA-dependent DNA polymerase)
MRSIARNLEIVEQAMTGIHADCGEPKTYDQAVKTEDSKSWKEAIKLEYKNIEDRKVWRIMKFRDMKKGMKPLDTRWVLKVKNDGRYRARLVVRGFTQVPGIDFHESHSPVANDVTVRILLVLALNNNWTVEQIDVETAFLYGELNETVYLRKPDGFNELSGSTIKDDEVLALDKSLYGLVQAARMWMKTFVDHLTSDMKFTRSRADPCLVWKNSKIGFIAVLIYVDDCAIFGTSEAVTEFQTQLSKRFNIKKMGVLSEYVGAAFKKVDDMYTVNQLRLTESISQEFDVPEKQVSTPSPAGEVLLKEQDNDDAMASVFRSGVGKLLYLVKLSRPDLASSVRELSKFMSNPSGTHLRAMYRTMSYATQTSSYGLKLKSNNKNRIVGYTDANWAACKDTRKSVSGSAIFYSGALVSWKSKTQQCTTLSSTESEYVALTSCVNEVIYIRNILTSLGIEVELPMTIFVDNTGAIHLSNNWSTAPRTKHISLRYHYVRELIEQGVIEIKFVRSEENVSDIFTKNLRQELFEKHQLGLGVGKVCSEKEGVEG